MHKFQIIFISLILMSHSNSALKVPIALRPLLNIINCLYWAGGCRQTSTLILFHLSAAFNNIYHSILIERLYTFIEQSDTVLNLFHSYLSNSIKFVYSGGSHYDFSFVQYKVPELSTQSFQFWDLSQTQASWDLSQFVC